MSNHAWLLVGLVSVFPSRTDAQTIPLTISCDDASGRPVASVQVMDGTIAKAAIDQDGRPVIRYDPRRVDGISTQQQLYVYAHECGHHALGHGVSAAPLSAVQEHEADCHAIRSLRSRLGFASDDVRILESRMRELEPRDAGRLPWGTRTYDFEGCLPEVIARREAARRAAEPTPNDCVIHNDAENAIVNESRDRRTIEATYSAGNRCTRPITCVFTIEVGTLPDTDIDLGSWRGFRAQKTLSESHTLAPAAAKTEFRFRESVEMVPAGESVDFRVLTACR